MLLGSDALASTLGVLVTWVLGEVLLSIVTGTVEVIILVSALGALGLLVTWVLLLPKIVLLFTGTVGVNILVRGLLVFPVSELDREGRFCLARIIFLMTDSSPISVFGTIFRMEDMAVDVDGGTAGIDIKGADIECIGMLAELIPSDWFKADEGESLPLISP